DGVDPVEGHPEDHRGVRRELRPDQPGLPLRRLGGDLRELRGDGLPGLRVQLEQPLVRDLDRLLGAVEAGEGAPRGPPAVRRGRHQLREGGPPLPDHLVTRLDPRGSQRAGDAVDLPVDRATDVLSGPESAVRDAHALSPSSSSSGSGSSSSSGSPPMAVAGSCPRRKASTAAAATAAAVSAFGSIHFPSASVHSSTMSSTSSTPSTTSRSRSVVSGGILPVPSASTIALTAFSTSCWRSGGQLKSMM